jgi:hypothetical protein
LVAASHSDPEAFAVFYRRYERLVAGGWSASAGGPA